MADTNGLSNESKVSEDSLGVGQPSYQGYEYQILATAWVALDLVTTNRAEAVVIEPPTEEDVAADVLPSERKADWGVKTAEVQIQIKLRKHALWQKSNFNELLKARTKRGIPGPQPRIRPLEYLEKKESRRYVLLTNADVDKGLSEFRVAKIGDLSTATRIPLARSDASRLASRIGILPPLTEDHLKAKIHEVLQRACHVPGEHLSECVETLLQVVRKRLLGELENRLSKAELLTVIRQYGGSYRERIEPIHSEKHGLLADQLSRRHALVLVGPPGTGKTTLAEWFVAGLESADPPFRRVSGEESRDPAQVRKLLAAKENHVFYFEDPWGQDPSAADSLLTSELPKLMKLARVGKVFVVTSRLNVFQAAVRGQEQLYDPFTQHLGPEDYSLQAFRALFDREINHWQTEKRTTARSWRKEALKHLQTPYSIQIFVGLLAEALDEGASLHRIDVEAMARKSNVGAFGAVLKQALAAEGPDMIAAAVAIWAQLLVRNRKINAGDARAVRDLLRDGGLTCPPDVMKLFNRLADGRWLQARSDGGYVATPSVLESLRMFESEEPAIYSDTLDALFQGWAKADSIDCILTCVKESPNISSIIPSALTDRVDQYLVSTVLSKEGYQFSYACSDLARFSTGDDPVALLARALERRSSTDALQSWMHERVWQPPTFDAEQINAITRSHQARTFTELFINHRLPDQARYHVREIYKVENLIAFLDQFDWDLAQYFQSSFTSSVRNWEEGSSILAECACKLDPAFIHTVVDESVQAFLRCQENDDASENEGYRQADQGEMDAAIAEGRYGEPPDLYFHAEEALRMAIKIKNSVDGYGWISNHEHAKHLLEHWARTLDDRASLSEIQAIAACCDRHRILDPIFNALTRKAHLEMMPWVVKQLFQEPTLLPHSWRRVLEEYVAEPKLLDLIRNEAKTHGDSDRAIVAFELLRRKPAAIVDADDETLSDIWSAIVLCIVSEDETDLLNRCLDPSELPLTETQKHTLRGFAEDWPEWPRILAVQALASAGEDVAQDLVFLLRCENVEVRKLAISLCTDKNYLLSNGLSDEEYSCRVTSLNVLASCAIPAERRVLCGLSTDASCYVREAIVSAIRTYRWPEGIPHLVAMLNDNRDYADFHYGNDPYDYDVARRACHALNDFDVLPDTELDGILSFLEKCEIASLDRTVHGLLFRILADHPSIKTASFCSQYVSNTWWKSGWKDNRGQALVPAALNAIIQIILQSPDLAIHVNTESLHEFAAFDDDVASLVAPAIVILCLMDEHRPAQFTELAKAPSFDIKRAILIHALCPSIRSSQELKEWIPQRHPFGKLLSWISDSADASSWIELLNTNPEVDQWIESLNQANHIDTYTSWAIGRLLSIVERESIRTSIPEHFEFADTVKP